MVKCLKEDLDELLTCYVFTDPVFIRKIRTTNAIERIFREVLKENKAHGGL
ncbi:MAG: hypothetical protein N3D15_06255 [Syntrophorhabdaceae bacterium]|nr:hypothetical protein [Syntrophorhabdaceae bacterium]